MADWWHLRWKECLEKSFHVIELARSAGDPRAEVVAHQWAIMSIVTMGDLGGARLQAAAALVPAERLRDQWWLASVLWCHSVVSCVKGDWEAARDFSDRSMAMYFMHPRHLASRVLLEYEVGNFQEGELYLERLLEVMRPVAPKPVLEYALPALVIPIVARIAGKAERLGVAAEAAETVCAHPSSTPAMAISARIGLALIAVEQRDAVGASEQYNWLVPQQGTLMMHSMRATDRLLGLLAQAIGRLDDAMAHFEDSLAFCRKAGARPELAWTCHDYGALRQAQGEREKALALLDESLAISTELGMRPLMERIGVLREQVESVPAKAPAYPDGLTQREIEVLRLIASGKSNQEIADELIISVNTVIRHVSNIFSKTGASNRAEAATYANQKGFVT